MALDQQYRTLRFADTDEVGEREVIELWERQGVLRGPRAAERAREVARVALDAENRLVGVSTVYLDRSAQLRTQMWHYRTYVHPDHRHSDVARNLLHETTVDLDQAFSSGRDTRAPGMVMYIQNEGIKRYWNQGRWINPPIWVGSEWPFIGESRHGEHVRVHWFPRAHAPLP